MKLVEAVLVALLLLPAVIAPLGGSGETNPRGVFAPGVILMAKYYAHETLCLKGQTNFHVLDKVEATAKRWGALHKERDLGEVSLQVDELIQKHIANPAPFCQATKAEFARL